MEKKATGINEAVEVIATGITSERLLLGLSGSRGELGLSLHRESCGIGGSSKQSLPCSGVLERGQEGLGLRVQSRWSHILGILRSSFIRAFGFSSFRHNDKVDTPASAGCVPCLVLAGLFFAPFMGMADERQNVLNDSLGLVALGIRADTVTLEGLRVVGDEPVKQAAELLAIPKQVNALLVSGANINDLVIVSVDNLEGLSVAVNRSANAEEQSSQGGLAVPSQLEVISGESEYQTKEGAEKGGDDFGGLHWFLLFFVVAFVIYEITWSHWFMNWTDRLYEKFLCENDQAHGARAEK